MMVVSTGIVFKIANADKLIVIIPRLQPMVRTFGVNISVIMTNGKQTSPKLEIKITKERLTTGNQSTADKSIPASCRYANAPTADRPIIEPTDEVMSSGRLPTESTSTAEKYVPKICTTPRIICETLAFNWEPVAWKIGAA